MIDVTNVTSWLEQQRTMERVRAKAPVVDARTNTADLTHLPDSITCAELAQRQDLMLQVSARTWNGIIVNEGQSEGLTLGDLRRRSYMELLRIPNVGRVSVAEFQRVFGSSWEAAEQSRRTVLEMQAERARLVQRVAEIDLRIAELERPPNNA
jgi:hypothetical protein